MWRRTSMHHLSDARAVHTAKSLLQNRPFHFSRHYMRNYNQLIWTALFPCAYYDLGVFTWDTICTAALCILLPQVTRPARYKKPLFLIDREFILAQTWKGRLAMRGRGAMVRVDRMCEAYVWACGRWCGVEVAGERGREGDGHWRLLRHLVEVGRESVSRWSNGMLLSLLDS